MLSPSEVERYQFGILGEQDHEQRGVVEVTSPELFTGSQPVRGGVYDLAMGTTDHSYRCLTCSQEKKECKGHEGKRRLKTGVINPIAVQEARRWLKITCPNCSFPVLNPDDYKHIPANSRLSVAAGSQTEGLKCPNCKAIHPKIVKDPEDHFTYLAIPADFAGSEIELKKRRLDFKIHHHVMKAIFQKIPDEVVEAFGRSVDVHPRKFILNTIQIPPTSIRPGVKSMGAASSASYHDITSMLQHIVKGDQLLPDRIPKIITPEYDRNCQTMNQLYYDMLLGSASTSVTQGNKGKRGIVVGGNSAPAILRRHPRKRGRIRDNLMGKRVVFIARTTISGNTGLALDEWGMPLWKAKVLQVKEHFHPLNFQKLMQYFQNGTKEYPGCTRLIKKSTGFSYDVANLRADFRPEIGDILFRDIISGDYCFVNRQPTLEKSSIGVHKVRVIYDPSVRTYQFNVSSCDWYNADFDGDQMNMWIPHDPVTIAEARIMSQVSNMFISTKTSGPVNGEVQDAIVGCRELTRSNVKLDKFHAMALFQHTGVIPPNFEGDADTLYSGRDLVSMLLRSTPINYSKTPTSYNEVYVPFIKFEKSEERTIIEGGKLISGVLDKKAIGPKAMGGIFHLIAEEYGSKEALNKIFALQQMALQFLLYRGFTVSTADLVVTEKARENIQEIVSKVVRESQIISDRLTRGEIIPPIGSTTHEHYEKLQRECLKANDSELMRCILTSIRTDTNGLFNMIAAGSKGNNANLKNIMGTIGQVIINQKRIEELFSFRRTSPYHPRFATDPAAYGYVASSYMSGMSTDEFIFSGMNGRFDLINKALSTSVTGYFMRKGVMSNQSLITDNYRRSAKNGRITQFLYGEDGLDARKIHEVDYKAGGYSDSTLQAQCGYNVKKEMEKDAIICAPNEAQPLQKLIDNAVERIRTDRDKFRDIFIRLEKGSIRKQFSTRVPLPVDIAKIIANVFVVAKEKKRGKCKAAELKNRLRLVQDLCAKFPYLLINEIQEKRGTPIPKHLSAAASLMVMQIRSELSPNLLSKITDSELTFIISSIRLKYSFSLISPGSAVGILACQAVSEPLTQYMLDSHHRSVAGGTNKAGLVRVQEIYGGKSVEDEQSPSMFLPVCDKYAYDLAKSQEIANNIEYLNFGKFVSKSQILFEPYSDLRMPSYVNDKEWMNEFENTHPLMHVPKDLTDWCFRIQFNKSMMVLKSISLERIVSQLRFKHPNLYIVHTPESVRNILMRIYIKVTQFKRGSVDEHKVSSLLETVLETPVRGIMGITTASVEKVTRTKVSPDGSLTKDERFAIVTVGTNLCGVMYNKFIKHEEVLSSSVDDTKKMFGIEAARHKIIAETRQFMEDSAPNLRHLMVYADEMTRGGKVTSVERGGLAAREPNNILLRMAASAPIQVATDAAFNTTKGIVYGISGPLLLGAMPKIGTLYNDLICNEEFIKANTISLDAVLDAQ